MSSSPWNSLQRSRARAAALKPVSSHVPLLELHDRGPSSGICLLQLLSLFAALHLLRYHRLQLFINFVLLNLQLLLSIRMLHELVLFGEYFYFVNFLHHMQ